MGKLKGLVNKGVGMLKDVKTYWKTPKPGNYLSFKEAAAYCIGGMGVVGGTVIPTYVTLSYGINIAAALKISNYDIFIIGIITSIITILRSPLCSWLIDNTRSRFGKFRPYLIWMPIPIIVCLFMIGWIPNALQGNYVAMLVVFAIIFNLLQFFLQLYTLSFTSLLQVISPKQSEKEMLMSFGSVVYSLGPSVVNFIFPLLANIMFSIGAGKGKIMGINTIGPYQWLLPLIMCICMALGYITAFGTKERIVTSKKYVQKVKFLEGVKKTVKNKYFWIINLSTAIGVFKLIGTTFVALICSYQIQEDWAQSVFTTLMGSACLPGMLLAPILIKKFGKKNLILFSNIFAIVLTAIMAALCTAPGSASAYIMLLFSFLITMVNAVQVVTTPAIGAQMYDYQQYKTGDRLEGFISQFGIIITTAIGIGTAFVQPFIYECFGYTGNNSEVLTQVNVFYPIVMYSCIAGIISGVLATIPFFFWDLSEKRHESIVEILKVRALKEDNQLSDETATELETKLEKGENNALTEYLSMATLTEAEEYISIKEDVNVDSVVPEGVIQAEVGAVNVDLDDSSRITNELLNGTENAVIEETLVDAPRNDDGEIATEPADNAEITESDTASESNKDK